MTRSIVPALALLASATSAFAQSADPQTPAEPPARIDIRVDPATYEGPLEDCSPEQEAAAISGEIVVCRRRRDSAQFGYDKERAQQRYATETMNKGDLRTPNVDGPGIFTGPATVGGLCGIGLNPCPPPPAYFIDFKSLPDAPPGSDADRIARGLAPLGRDGQLGAAAEQARVLGLPPAPAAPAEGEGPPVSPSGSASPAAEPSG